MPVIDLNELKKITADDEDLLADVSVMFVRFLPDVKARMCFGIENHELADLETCAHQMRSRVGYLGAPSLQEIASQIELAARKNETENLAQLNQSLFDGIDLLLDELRAITKLALEVDYEQC